MKQTIMNLFKTKKTMKLETKVCDVTGIETTLDNFYDKQSHIKYVDNMRRNKGISKENLKKMFNQLNNIK